MKDVNSIKTLDELNVHVAEMLSVSIVVTHEQLISLIAKTDKELADTLLSDLASQLELDKVLSNAVSHNYHVSDMFDTVYSTIVNVLTQKIDNNEVSLNNDDFELYLTENVKKLDTNIERLVSRFYSSDVNELIELSSEQLKLYVASNNQRIFVFCHSLIESQRYTAMNTRFLRDMLVDSVYMTTHELVDKKKNSIHNSLEYMRKMNILEQTVIDLFASSSSNSLRAETIINSIDCYEFLKAINNNINNSAYEIESNERELNIKVNISLTFNLNATANSIEKSSTLYNNQLSEHVSK